MATTTAIRAGITDWADLGIPGTGSIMVLQPTNADTLFAIADVKPSVSPPVGFHLDPRRFTRVTLNTPTVTHMWAYQPTKGGVVSTGGYVIVQSLAVPLAGRSQTRSGGVASISSLKVPLAARSQTVSKAVL